MNNNRGLKIAILGGGVSGLFTAYFLSQAKFKIDLYEKENFLGGLSGNFKLNNNNYADRFYHFICLEDKEYFKFIKENNLSSYLNFSYTKMGYFFKDKLIPFSSPLDILKLNFISTSAKIKYLTSMLKIRTIKNWKYLDTITAKEWLINLSGKEVYKKIWEKVLEGKFSYFKNEISAAWMWARLNRVASSRTLPFFKEKMGYLKGTTKILLNFLEANIIKNEGEIFLNSTVEKINFKNNIPEEIIVNKERKKYDLVISCLPYPLLVKILSENLTKTKLKINNLNYTGVICGVFLLKEKLQNNFWVNINSKNIPLVNLVEQTNLDNKTHFGGSVVYLPYYLNKNDKFWQFTAKEIFNIHCSILKKINNSFTDNLIIDYHLFKNFYAQPICDLNFLQKVPPRQIAKNLYVIESSQLYPADRTISGCIKLAQKLTKKIIKKYKNAN